MQSSSELADTRSSPLAPEVGISTLTKAAIATASVVILALIALMPRFENLRLGDFLAVVLGLAVLGFVAARLAGRDHNQQRHLTLADDIAADWDARLGPERVVQRTLSCLREQYGADICVFVLTQPTQPPRIFCIEAGDRDVVEVPSGDVPLWLARLGTLPSGHTVVFNPSERHRWWRRHENCLDYGSHRDRDFQRLHSDAAAAIAGVLDCASFVSLPMSRETRIGGRLFVGTRQDRIGDEDVTLLRPVVEQITLMLENACLLAMLLEEAARNERQRLARDLHDTAVQPYIGLKFGLEALMRKVRDDELLRDIRRLVERTQDEIADMRQLIGGLYAGGSANRSLLTQLERQAARFSQLFGICIYVAADGETAISPSLAREILRMVSEGLSNICRHTLANIARIELNRQPDQVVLRICNNRGEGDKAPKPFQPASLSERAKALGGSVAVDSSGNDGWMVVAVRIPLAE